MMGNRLVVVALIGMVACSKGGASAPASVQVSGNLNAAVWVCKGGGTPMTTGGNGIGPSIGPPGVDPTNTEITFKDSAGKIVGTTSTGASSWVMTGITTTSCSHSAPYSITLPRSDFYQVQVAGASQPFTVKYADVSDGSLDVSLTGGS